MAPERTTIIAESPKVNADIHADPPAQTTRTRLMTEALRLFADNGYAATSVADLERAAGLAPGRGGLYRHFESKYALLVAAVQHQAAQNSSLIATFDEVATVDDRNDAPRQSTGTVTTLAWAGLRRLREERSLTRLLIKDLDQFPELLEVVAASDIRPVIAALEKWLTPRVDPAVADPGALAAVLSGAVTHLWLLEDLFGTHPSGVTTDDYMRTLIALCEQTFASDPT